MSTMKTIGKYIPGFVLAIVIAAIAKLVEGLLPVHLIGASVTALFIGMIINAVRQPAQMFSAGLKFTSKKILKFAIILLGASLNISIVLEVGKLSLCVILYLADLFRRRISDRKGTEN